MDRWLTAVALMALSLAWTGEARAQASISQDQCTVETLGSSIPSDVIGEPVSGVTLSPPVWNTATNNAAAHCSVDGVMSPANPAPYAQPINFRVALPALWNGRAAQLGGGGINGVIPNLTGAVLGEGYTTYGSDSGHQINFAAFGRGRGRGGRGGPPPGRGGGAARGAPPTDDWTLNDEAIRNLGYAQMKKTHDAAMVLIDRMYSNAPAFNYYIGNSQGGREALMVASRYAADYDGIVANVPIVSFSSLMLAPELIRIQEKPLDNFVTAEKVNAIRGEFMRQCDQLDGLVDGVINNYMACRDRFDVSGDPVDAQSPWAAKRCANNVDPDPADMTADACLTDGQIETLEFVYSPYVFASPLAFGVDSFGMWVPTTDPSGSGLILDTRFRGQEGADEDAPMHSHLGVLGVTGFLMQDLEANPLDYVEGGQWEARRLYLSEILDGTNPDFSAFRERGGKMIVTIGTNDTLASPGAQLDFYQSLIDTMGRDGVDNFARLFVLPQTGHGLSGTSYEFDGNGDARDPLPIPNQYDRLQFLTNWVEGAIVPGLSLTVTAGERSLPLCSYPAYPRYDDGPEGVASSYTCTQP